MFEFHVGNPRAVLTRPEATEKAFIDTFDLKFDSRVHHLESEPLPWSGWDALREEVKSLDLQAPNILHLQAWDISVALPVEIEPAEIVMTDEGLCCMNKGCGGKQTLEWVRDNSSLCLPPPQLERL